MDTKSVALSIADAVLFVLDSSTYEKLKVKHLNLYCLKIFFVESI
jgi:hypothetical protein